MPRQAYLGNKIRRLRKDSGRTQVQLAKMLGISASYLNLIERNQRSLTVPLLLNLAEIFQLDLKSFAEDDEGQLVADLREAFGDPLFRDLELGATDIRDLIAASPDGSRALRTLYRAYRKTRQDLQTITADATAEGRLYGLESSRLPSEEVSDFIQEHGNHFPVLEEAAEDLWKTEKLSSADLRRDLVQHLDRKHGVEVRVDTSESLAGAVRRFDPVQRQLVLSEALPSSSLTFQLAHQIALLSLPDLLDSLVDGATLSTDDSRRLGRVALANYFSSAVVMPYERFLEAAKGVRYDVEILGHRFRSSFEQVCHRLTSLSRPDTVGIPFHLVRIDIAGNISKRFSGSGIRFARYSGACPRWNVHAAFLTPGFIRTQLSETPDGTLYFSIARTVRKAGGGHHVSQSRLAIELGCDAKHAREMVYSDGIDLSKREAAIPVGVSCRLCERMNCRQRAFPPMHHRLEVDENVRGLSFYYSPGRED